MLVWLDGSSSIRGNPNENFARELQELFTMGVIDPVTGTTNYTEQDVKEIARAFTGWRYRRPDASQPFIYQFYIDAARTDTGSKTIYGQTGNFSGQDVITTICDRMATGRFLVHKLFTFFVYPLRDDSTDKATIERFADVYVQNNHSIKELVRAIFTSDEFFSARARFALVKSPVELVAGSLRILKAQYNPGTTTTRRDTTLYSRSASMGMDLFRPPDVSGWDLNLGWVGTTTMLERYNFANQFISNRPTATDAPGAFVTNQQLSQYIKPTAKKTARRFLAILGPLEASKDVVMQLKAYLETDDSGSPVPFVSDETTIDKKIRGLVHQIMSLPEYHLN
jgi:uncharacterized protein (DUF1800 family)